MDVKGNSRIIDLLDIFNGGTGDAGAVELVGDVGGVLVATVAYVVNP